jgi:hypothetical protein
MIVKVNQIAVGDIILPPERELSLWMRRHIAEKGLDESALHLTVLTINHSRDKRGPWIHIRAQYPPTWGHTSTFSFKARPETDWRKI